MNIYHVYHVYCTTTFSVANLLEMFTIERKYPLMLCIQCVYMAWCVCLIFFGVKHWRSRPNYSVLVDTRDRQEPQTTYVAEENIQLSNHVQVGLY